MYGGTYKTIIDYFYLSISYLLDDNVQPFAFTRLTLESSTFIVQKKKVIDSNSLFTISLQVVDCRHKFIY